jgi:hypothetical protein
MTRDDHGRLRLDCKLGTYFHSLSTSEALDPELTEAYAAWPGLRPGDGLAEAGAAGLAA